MNILVLNGSPKGKNSITLQTVNYLDKLSRHTFNILHVGQRIKLYEKDMSEAISALNAADLIIFAYPVYTFIAPSQLHRFIELIKESGVDISGKFATQLTTSKHFYDVTAHRYIEENCYDLGLKYVKGLSADMDDLLSERGRREAKDFFKYVMWCMKNDVYEKYISIKRKPKCRKVKPYVSEIPNDEKSGDIVIVTNCHGDDIQLQSMIDRFRAKVNRKTRVFNILEYNFSGGCLGCFNCAVTGKCIYKDGFDDYLRDNIQTAEAIVFAFTIKDHSMGASFKMYDDRQFCNGHRTVTMGMPMGYLVSGNLSEEANLKMIIEGRASVGGNYLCGVATDEQDTSDNIDKLAGKIEYALENKQLAQKDFLGVGGMKIFRDLIWVMQGMMKADHKFYKEHGQYDFPQKQKGRMIAMYGVGALMSNKKLKAKIGGKMTEGMLMPYNKVLNRVKAKEKK